MPVTRESKIVGSCGLLGGVIAFLYAYSTDNASLGQGLMLAVQLSLYCLGGVAAAIIGVFLLANTERNDELRLAATGLLFGIFWIQVLNQAGSSIATTNIQQKAEVVKDKAAALAAEESPSVEKVTELVGLSSGLLTGQANYIGEPEDRVAITESIVDSVAAVKRLRDSDPAAAEEAFSQLEDAAKASQVPGVADIVGLAR